MNSIIKPEDVRRVTKPARLGFLGAGWIGKSRMEAMLATGLVTAQAIADPCAATLEAALAAAPAAEGVLTLDELLDRELDGIVIATPSAQHADQAILALNAGVAVFCQKPLGRDAAEVRAVVEAARTANVLLGVDLSYRHTRGMQRIKELLDAQALGDVMAVDLTFHNAYGPDKPWFYDREQSGGGCLIDLGVHLIDLALWALDFPRIISVSSHLMVHGKSLLDLSGPVEDFAVATLQLENRTVVRIACSWRLNAGTDCVIDATFYGTDGGAAMRNINGSFYDFAAEKFSGTSKETLVMPPDDWGAQAAIAWAKQLSLGSHFDPASENLVTVSETIDQIYRSSKV